MKTEECAPYYYDSYPYREYVLRDYNFEGLPPIHGFDTEKVS